MTKSKKRTVLLHGDKATDMQWRLPWSPAKQKVECPITLSNTLLGRSKRGIPFECLIAEGIMDFAKAQPDAFPHPVHYAYVLPSSIYIVDQVERGNMRHCVRYLPYVRTGTSHSFSNWTRQFDKLTPAQFAKQYGGEGLRLVLRKGKDARGREVGNPRKRPPGKPLVKRVLGRGAEERARLANLLPQIAA